MNDGGWTAPGGGVPPPPGAPLPEPPPHVLPPVRDQVPAAGWPAPPGPQPSQQQWPQQQWPQQQWPQQAPHAWPQPYGQPAPWQPPAAAGRRPEVADRPRPYPQLLRGPDHRWWKPLASTAFAVVVGFTIVLVGSIVAVVLIAMTSGLDSLAEIESTLSDEEFYGRPAGFLMNNLILAALIPTAMVAVWLVHRWRPRWLSSVRPGIRWGWLLECTGWSVVFVGVLFGLGLLLDEESIGWSPQPQFWVFVAIVLVTQPLQAAGEEYAFRGLLTQAVGSWFARPAVGALVAGVVSATLFAFAHGSQSPWLFADRFVFGAAASVLVWRTGGLEAGIALHAVNNLYAIGVALVTGTLAESITATDYPPLAAVVDIALICLVTAVMSWRAHRTGLQRLHDPALQPDRWRTVQPQPAGPVPAGGWAPYAALGAQAVPQRQPYPPPAYPPPAYPPPAYPPPAYPPPAYPPAPPPAAATDDAGRG